MMDIQIEDLPSTSLEQLIWHLVRRSFSNKYPDSIEQLLREIPLDLDQHNRWIDNAKNDLMRAQNLSKEEWARHCENEYQARLEMHERLCASYQKRKAILADKILEVEAWQPPSDDHSWIKRNLMRDLQRRFDSAKPDEMPERPKDWEQTRANAIERAKRIVLMHEKMKDEAIEGKRREAQFLQVLHDAIGNPPPEPPER